MAISLGWADDSQTILYCDVLDQWTWDDFHRTAIDAQVAIAGAHQTVHIVIHTLNAPRLPAGTPFPHFKKALQRIPDNTGLIILITQRNIVKMAAAIVGKLYDMRDRFFVVSSIQQARTILTERIEKQKRKDRIVDALKSGDNRLALRAVEELRSHDWLYDGSLENANLTGAQLQGANLFLADMRGAQLAGANLEQAYVYSVNLEGASLFQAYGPGAIFVQSNLQGTIFRQANLQYADLTEALLNGGDLCYADLRGACLRGADLFGAELTGAWFDQETILPDGSFWSPEIDLMKYTDANYNAYWQHQTLDEETQEAFGVKALVASSVEDLIFNGGLFSRSGTELTSFIDPGPLEFWHVAPYEDDGASTASYSTRV